MKTKKLLSILLALMMMLSVVPMYASAAEALSASNVTQWPTYNYKNGQETVFFGQTFDEALAINDDEIVLDSAGDQVAGHFEFKNPTGIPTSATSAKATIVFVPDDTSKYGGFSKSRSVVVYSVQKTTPVYIDEVNDPVVATKVEAGATLSTSILSGGKMTNPYNENEPILLARSWEWADPNTIVNESGYFNAIFYPANYNQVTAQVYVDIAVDIIESEISVIPSIPALTYDGVTTWNDIALSNGVAVEKDTTNVVEGTFAITDSWKAKVIEAGTYEVDATFIPNDTEAYTKVDFKIPVTVNKAPIKFVDENGEDIVPEITVPYGTKFNDIARLLNPYIKGPEYVYFVMGDLSSQLCANGTYTVTATAPSDGAHYEDTELTFKIVVEPKVINPKAYSSTEGYYVYDNSGVYHVEGTFDVYVNDELIASDVAYNSGKVKWEATENGTYTMKWVYNPVENDNFIINDVTTKMNVIFPNTITFSGIRAYILGDNGKSELSETTERKQGSSVTIGCDAPAFAAWVITDAKGNTVDLGIEDLTATEITFVMPDYDIVITTKTELEIAAENCDHICHSDNPLFQMLWKVLTFIFRLFDVQQYCDCGNLHYDAPLFG